jgi:hypothetical protein
MINLAVIIAIYKKDESLVLFATFTCNYKKYNGYGTFRTEYKISYLLVNFPMIPDAFCLSDEAVLSLLPLLPLLVVLPAVLFAPPPNTLDAFCLSDDVKL